jgi:hypothetical protein
MGRTERPRVLAGTTGPLVESVATELAANSSHAEFAQGPTRRIDDITVGERHRKDLGDVDGLAASIAELGLLQPVVVRPDGALIAGVRRLHAAQQLGWTDIPVTIVDIDAVVRGEFAENSIRKDFTLSESVAIKRALEPAERAAAQERMRTGKPSEKFDLWRCLQSTGAALRYSCAGRERNRDGRKMNELVRIRSNCRRRHPSRAARARIRDSAAPARARRQLPWTTGS